ncbi:MAG: hypothetical protein AB1898_09875 [Acidobacteriota bacterium]
MEKLIRILECHEDKTSGTQLFQIHEVDPPFKIDRIVYREKSKDGWFKEITPDTYFEKVRSLGKRVALVRQRQ